jgi:hypothetical protein
LILSVGFFIELFENTTFGWTAKNFQIIQIDGYDTGIEHSNNSIEHALTPHGRVYKCGYTLPFEAMFPDYESVREAWDPNLHNTSTNDILVYGMHGKCSIKDVTDLLEKFHGKVLYHNGEPHGNIFQDNKDFSLKDPNQFKDRVYQTGPYPKQHDNNTRNNHNITDSIDTIEQNQSLLLHQLTTVLLRCHYLQNQTRYEWVVNPSKKRHNTGHYNAVVYFAKRCAGFRQQAATNISTILPLHHGKHCKINSANATISPIDTDRASYLDNPYIFVNYKYCLVMENSNVPGCMTEKLLNGFLGGCLPIYYGSSSDVYSVFSKDSFVFYDINDPQPALELLRQLSTNESLYEEMLTKPILKDGNSTVDAYFSLFPEIGDGSINWQIREMMGLP